MTNPIDQIDAKLALCARATSGPWDVETDGDGGEFGPEDEWPWRIKGVCNFSEEGGDEHDAAFIAASRTGWEATLRALKVACEALGQARKNLCEENVPPWAHTDVDKALAEIAKELEAT